MAASCLQATVSSDDSSFAVRIKSETDRHQLPREAGSRLTREAADLGGGLRSLSARIFESYCSSAAQEVTTDVTGGDRGPMAALVGVDVRPRPPGDTDTG